AREPRRLLPALVARRDARRGVLPRRRRIDLEQQERPRQLAVEVLRELGRARVQRRAHALAFRVADASQPPVLERREQRNQAEQRGREQRKRRPESPPHTASLARAFAPKSARARGFTSLTNSLRALNHSHTSKRDDESSESVTYAQEDLPPEGGSHK